MLSRLQEVALSPNLQKQTQKVKQNEEIKKYARTKDSDRTSDKELNETELRNLPDKVKSMAKRYSPDLRDE